MEGFYWEELSKSLLLIGIKKKKKSFILPFIQENLGFIGGWTIPAVKEMLSVWFLFLIQIRC